MDCFSWKTSQKKKKGICGLYLHFGGVQIPTGPLQQPPVILQVFGELFAFSEDFVSEVHSFLSFFDPSFLTNWDLKTIINSIVNLTISLIQRKTIELDSIPNANIMKRIIGR